jgi:purine nucleosidase
MDEKILLDTDIGYDIDDAVCLAYLLAKPACDLLGITTVTGEPERRAQMVSALCRAAGKDVPIYPGAPAPLLVEQIQTLAPQAIMLNGMDYQQRFPVGEAVDFLRTTIRAHPGEITLLTIGPLTNAALLFAVDPEIPSMLKGWVGMGGLFSHRVAGLRPREYNMLLDPHAAARLYQTPLKIHRSVGIEVTSQLYLSEEEIRAKFRGTLLEMTLKFAEVWFRMFSQGITFHDPLAAAVIFDPHICQFERGKVEVELESSRLAGFTHWTPVEDGPHEVAVSVDRERFFQEYFSVFSE